MLSSAPYFYRYYTGQGQAVLSSELQAPDPFALAPASIVERILDGGHTPDLERPQRAWFCSYGIVSIVDQKGQRFVVCIDTDGQRISVEEVRNGPYDGGAGVDDFHGEKGD